MVGARSAAMAFNRIADRSFDARNPRTASRALPAGLLSVGLCGCLRSVSAAVFVFSAAMLNRLTLILSPVALACVLLYSFTKRWTQFSHLVLGACLSIAPTGAWIAVRGEIGRSAVAAVLVVLLWTAGFDILYACQDYDSIVAKVEIDSARVWYRPRTLDCTRTSRGRISGIALAVSDYGSWTSRICGSAGNRRVTYLPAPARSRRRSRAFERGVLYYQRFCKRDIAGHLWQRSFPASLRH